MERGGGQKLALGYAYRSGTLNSLGYVRYQRGSLSGGQDQLAAGLSADYHLLVRPRLDLNLRGGADLRVLSERATLTYQPYLGVSAALDDRVQIGAWGRALVQPATHTSLYGYGLEAGVRALPGTWLNVGYNFRGFDGVTTGMYTRPGAYLRLDLTVDETLRGQPTGGRGVK